MASRFDENLAIEHEQAFAEFMEDVTRRPNGDKSRGYAVSNVIVELDSAAATVAAQRGGLIDNQKTLSHEEGAKLIVPVSEKLHPNDHWVIRGRLYVSLGGPTHRDGASQTIVVVRKNHQRGREPRATAHVR